MLEQLRKLLSDHQIQIEPKFNTGVLRNGSQWFVGKHWHMGDKDFYTANFGDFKQAIEKSWQSNDPNYTPEEVASFKTKNEELLKLEEELKQKLQFEVRVEVEKEWPTFNKIGTHPYLQAKKITSLFGARLKSNPPHEDILIVPLRDVDGNIWNYQRIYAKKFSNGNKFMLEGGRIEGLFCILGEVEPKPLADYKDKTVYLCEGFATGCSIALSNPTANAVFIVCLNANNLVHVATTLKSHFKNFIVCADNDHATKIQGRLVNVGLNKARSAAEILGAAVRYPIFKHDDAKLTDFNDLHCVEGLEEVRSQIEKQKYKGLIVPGIEPMELSYRKGVPQVPSEKDVADYILKHMGENLIRQNKSLWKWCGTHWEELDQGGIDYVKLIISQVVHHTLGSRDIEAYFKTLFLHTKQVPKNVDLYQPNPFVANFQDKTLHLVKQNDLIWTNHRREDFLTSVLPFNAPGGNQGEAPNFEMMLQRIWGDHPEFQEIRRLIKQIMGACLIQCYPIIAIFKGAPGTGKSTIIKLMVKLLNRKNVCSVGPTEMHGFHMENMIHKLVNYDTDIDTNRPISDSVIKKLIDREPIKVNRKGISMVSAYLPAVHLFACNQLPKSLDGASKAYERRFTIIPTERVIPTNEEVFDFEQRLLDLEQDLIVNAAFEGLKDLVESRGKFQKLKDSSRLVDELQLESDPVEQFVRDLKNGGVDAGGTILKAVPDQKYEKTKAWTAFSYWQNLNCESNRKIGRYAFYKQMRDKGFPEGKMTDGDTKCFIGIADPKSKENATS